MKQTLVSTSILLLLISLFVSFGNINCSDNVTNTQTSNINHKMKPALYKVPNESTPMNVFIPNPGFDNRGADCKFEICHCCTDSGRYFEMYDIEGGPAVGSWYTNGSQCLGSLASTFKGHTYVVYEYNQNCPEDQFKPTYFTTCTCDTEEDRDTVRCCPLIK